MTHCNVEFSQKTRNASRSAFFGSSPHPISFMHLQRLYIRIVKVYRQKFLQYTGEAKTMLEWAKRMTWKGLHPIVELSHKVYQKGIVLGKAAMQAVEKRLERHPALPKYDILINPAPTS
jgi:hypothetical protein